MRPKPIACDLYGMRSAGRYIHATWLLIALGASVGMAPAQAGVGVGPRYDTVYVKDHSRLLTGRLFLGTRYDRLRLGSSAGAKPLVFSSNNRYSLGMGIGYRGLAVALAVGLPGPEQAREKRGRTRYWGTRADLHTRRWATTLLLHRYKGYYLSSHSLRDLAWQQGSTFPTRSDLRVFEMGLNTLHVFNHQRFSYRAAFHQDTRQLQSQGSWLAGGFLTYRHLRADSSLVPRLLAPYFDDGLHLRRGGFTEVGLSGGYAYTHVIRQRFFVTASLVGGLGPSMQRTRVVLGTDEHRSAGTSLSWRSQVLAVVGYDDGGYYFGISLTQENIGYLTGERNGLYHNMGQVRFTLAHRFGGRLDALDQQLDRIRP